MPRSPHGHRTTGAKEHVQFKVTVSFLEVYNENIRDLLSFHDDDKREEGGIVMARGADGYQYVTPTRHPPPHTDWHHHRITVIASASSSSSSPSSSSLPSRTSPSQRAAV